MAQKDIFSAMMFGQPLEKEKSKTEKRRSVQRLLQVMTPLTTCMS